MLQGFWPSSLGDSVYIHVRPASTPIRGFVELAAERPLRSLWCRALRDDLSKCSPLRDWGSKDDYGVVGGDGRTNGISTPSSQGQGSRNVGVVVRARLHSRRLHPKGGRSCFSMVALSCRSSSHVGARMRQGTPKVGCGLTAIKFPFGWRLSKLSLPCRLAYLLYCDPDSEGDEPVKVRPRKGGGGRAHVLESTQILGSKFDTWFSWRLPSCMKIPRRSPGVDVYLCIIDRELILQVDFQSEHLETRRTSKPICEDMTQFGQWSFPGT